MLRFSGLTLILLTLAVLCACCVQQSQMVDDAAMHQTAPAFESALATYRRLKPLKGHFEGGEWQAEIDAFEGPMHQAMMVIQTALSQRHFDSFQLLQWLGEPDEKEQLSDTEERWLYYWRGRHDYLYFDFEAEQVKRIDWYYAFE